MQEKSRTATAISAEHTQASLQFQSARSAHKCFSSGGTSALMPCSELRFNSYRCAPAGGSTSAGFTQFTLKGPIPCTCTIVSPLHDRVVPHFLRHRHKIPDIHRLKLRFIKVSPIPTRNTPRNTVTFSSVGCQCAGIFDPSAHRIRITNGVPSAFGSPDTAARSHPLIMGVHFKSPYRTILCAAASSPFSCANARDPNAIVPAITRHTTSTRFLSHSISPQLKHDQQCRNNTAPSPPTQAPRAEILEPTNPQSTMALQETFTRKNIATCGHCFCRTLPTDGVPPHPPRVSHQPKTQGPRRQREHIEASPQCRPTTTGFSRALRAGRRIP